MVLIVLYFLFSFFVIFSVNKPRHAQLNTVFICGLICFWMTGIRWQYGGDWDTYYDFFTNYKNLDFDNSFEIGYNLLTFVIHSVIPHYTAFQFLMAAIIFFTTFNAIKRLSVIPILSFLLCFTLFDGGLPYVRKGVAACIVLYSYCFVVKRDIKSFFITIALACSIHFTAFVAIPMYWVYSNESSYKKYAIVFVCSTLLFYVMGSVLLTGIPFLGDFLNYKINNYIEAHEAGEQFGLTMTPERAMVNHILRKIFIIVYIIIYCKNYIKIDKVFRGFFNIYIASSIFYCSVVPIAFQFARMSAYMECVEIFIYAYIYKYLRGPNRKAVFLFLTVFFNAWRIWGHADVNQPEIYNYQTIFDF